MNQFLPVTKADLAERGWEEFDFLVITGDAYVDPGVQLIQNP